MKLPIKKLMTTLTTAFALSFAALTATPAQASDGYSFKTVYVNRSAGVKVKVKQKVRLGLNGWTHVQKIKIKTSGPVYGGLRVYANGVVRTGAYINDGYYFDVNEAIDAIEVMNHDDYDYVLGGVSIIANTHGISIRAGFSGRGYIGSFPSEVVQQIIDETTVLAYEVNLQDQMTYLEPIRIAAGRAMAMAIGRGEVSMKTGNALIALIAQMDFAEAFVTQRLQVNRTYWNAVRLVAAKERLADMIDYEAPGAPAPAAASAPASVARL